MAKCALLTITFFILIGKISSEKHELVYNDDTVYYDECRITVSPRNYLQPVRAFAQIQKPCNGTLLWTYPNLYLTLTLVNLEKEPFTLCFNKKALDDKFIRGIRLMNSNTSELKNMRETNGKSNALLCADSTGERITTVIDAEPLYGGVYLQYAMFNGRHPWTSGPNPGWERSEKYLFGPPELIQGQQKQMRRNRKKLH